MKRIKSLQITNPPFGAKLTVRIEFDTNGALDRKKAEEHFEKIVSSMMVAVAEAPYVGGPLSRVVVSK
jgi:hypothetical protein